MSGRSDYNEVRALVAVRKDIESSYQIVRGVVEELARDGIFHSIASTSD